MNKNNKIWTTIFHTSKSKTNKMRIVVVENSGTDSSSDSTPQPSPVDSKPPEIQRFESATNPEHLLSAPDPRSTRKKRRQLPGGGGMTNRFSERVVRASILEARKKHLKLVSRSCTQVVWWLAMAAANYTVHWLQLSTLVLYCTRTLQFSRHLHLLAILLMFHMVTAGLSNSFFLTDKALNCLSFDQLFIVQFVTLSLLNLCQFFADAGYV